MTKRAVHVAVFDTFADWEIGHATAHIRKPDWQVDPGRYEIVTVGVTRDPIVTMGGMSIVPDITLAELDPDDSAMLILAGGETWHDEVMVPFRQAARAFLAAGTPVAAVCGATFGLAVEGLLDNRPHTSNAAEYLAYSGYAGAAHFVDEPAVTDGDLITGSGVAPAHFAREVLARLGVYDDAILASWFKLYAHRDPAGFYELMSA